MAILTAQTLLLLIAAFSLALVLGWYLYGFVQGQQSTGKKKHLKSTVHDPVVPEPEPEPEPEIESPPAHKPAPVAASSEPEPEVVEADDEAKQADTVEDADVAAKETAPSEPELDPKEAPEPAPTAAAAPLMPTATEAEEEQVQPALKDAGKAAEADKIGKRPKGFVKPIDDKADDLKIIKGIGPQNEKKLNELGIYHFHQIADWTPEQVDWVGAYLAFPGRITREKWVDQAKNLI